MPTRSTNLSTTQAALLERVCLKRFRVIHEGFMGSFRPHETVIVRPVDVDGPVFNQPSETFRTNTLNALCKRGLVRILPSELGGDNSSEVKPTRAGLDLFRVSRGK